MSRSEGNGARRGSAAWGVVVFGVFVLSLGEVRLFERLLFEDQTRLGFVLENVTGVLHGAPSLPSWQHRVFGPALVSALSSATGDLRSAYRLYFEVSVFAANALLFWVLRRKGTEAGRSLFVLFAFGFVRALLMYRLEYPWDAVDVLLFLVFGYWVARGGSPFATVPLLLLGLVNHETVLYVPVWYLLSWLEHARDGRTLRRETAFGAVSLAVLAGGTAFLRERVGTLAAGPPSAPVNPWVSNEFHLVHNLRQLFVENWSHGRSFISLALLSVLVLLVAFVRAKRSVRAAVWSLVVIVTIFCSGYVNETRHYLPLVAFWFAYAS